MDNVKAALLDLLNSIEKYLKKIIKLFLEKEFPSEEEETTTTTATVE